MNPALTSLLHRLIKLPLLALPLLLLSASCVTEASATPSGSPIPPGSLYVVVSAQSPVQAISQRELIALYTGRTRAFSNGELAQPLDQRRDGPAREAFYQALTGMDLARINSYWARLHFTGQVQPPAVVGDDDAMVARIRQTPTAIGYLTQPPADASVRVLLTLP